MELMIVESIVEALVVVMPMRPKRAFTLNFRYSGAFLSKRDAAL
jgi:hypothetical protein